MIKTPFKIYQRSRASGGVLLFLLILFLTVFSPNTAQAQYIDIDLGQIAQDAVQYAEEIAQWAEQEYQQIEQYTDTQDEDSTLSGGFTSTGNAIQLNAEENSAVLQGTSQAIIDNTKIVAQTQSAARRQANAVVPVLSTGCTIASAYQKRDASQIAANSASMGYVAYIQKEGTGAYGAVPDNSSAASIAKRLCGRTGGSGGTTWSFIDYHGGLEGQVQCH